MKVLVIGGTLFIGKLLVEELLKEGHDVAVLHRKPKHDFGRKVENLMADRNDAAALREALARPPFRRGIRQCLTILSAAPRRRRWKATIRACGDRISRYVFMSSVAAYGDGLNHRRAIRWRRIIIPTRMPATRPPRSACSSACTRPDGLPVVTLPVRPFVYGARTTITASSSSGTTSRRTGRSSSRATATG